MIEHKHVIKLMLMSSKNLIYIQICDRKYIFAWIIITSKFHFYQRIEETEVNLYVKCLA